MSRTLADKATLSFPAAPPTIVSGMDAVLRMQPQLAQLADQCQQAGAADYIHYFLTQPYTGGKIPTLVLFPCEATADASADPFLGAVLVHQYQKLGVPLGIFVTEDTGGERNILAAAPLRSDLAVRAARFLIQAKGARLVVLSLRDASFQLRSSASECRATTSRTLKRYLPLERTYEQTLDTFGAHTRRNFRLYRRRAHDCTFEPQASLSEAEFLHLNELSDHKVPPQVALWRYRSTHREPGAVFAGLRAADKQWLSIVGGRRYHGTFAMDWQMNRAGLPALSLTTLMRGFLIEHEISAGTRQMLFEGGTPHPMHSAFLEEQVTDLVCAPRSLTAALVLQHAHRFLPAGNFLKQTLLSPALTWHTTSSDA